MSEVKVNKISPRSGTEVTLGDSGDTFTIPSGATINNQGTATNFGATGSASWTTTVKTSGFTAVAGEGYFVNTTGGAVSVNLPAGTAGAVVAFKDYAGTFDTNALTLVQNGSDKIGGSTTNAIITAEGVALTLIFIDSTQGWLVTDDGSQSVASTNPYMVATGGTETTSGNCRIHTFTGPGSFCVSKIASSAADNVVSYVVVAGGGGGGGDYGAGGGAGGYRELVSPSSPYTGSPLNGYPSAPNRITVTATAFPITIGSGGNKGTRDTSGTSGSNSVFSTITSTGGGKGGMQVPSDPSSDNGAPGGSGGGARYGPATVGSGNTPPTTPSQGNNGGAGHPSGTGGHAGGGGGGAGAVGGTAPNCNTSGAGGNGVTSEITASSVARGGGGGAAGGGGTHGQDYTPGPGGTGGGGAGAEDTSSGVGGAGTVNTGGGGGGGNLWTPTSCGGNGGSGVVIIRYRYQ